ncbi:hypothetical protein DFAR_3990014 [Desulfarculales bacterium]
MFKSRIDLMILGFLGLNYAFGPTPKTKDTAANNNSNDDRLTPQTFDVKSFAYNQATQQKQNNKIINIPNKKDNKNYKTPIVMAGLGSGYRPVPSPILGEPDMVKDLQDKIYAVIAKFTKQKAPEIRKWGKLPSPF